MLGMWVTDLRLYCLWWIALFIFRSIYPVHPLHVLGATLLHLVIVKIVMSARQMAFQICTPSGCRYHQIMVGVGSVHLLLARHLCRCLMVCPNKGPFLSLSWMAVFAPCYQARHWRLCTASFPELLRVIIVGNMMSGRQTAFSVRILPGCHRQIGVGV